MFTLVVEWSILSMSKWCNEILSTDKSRDLLIKKNLENQLVKQ